MSANGHGDSGAGKRREKHSPSPPDMSSFSLSSGRMSSSLETADMKSSSESIPLDVLVRGVGGAASGPAEAMILLLGRAEVKDIVASAAFRFRVVGGMVPVYRGEGGSRVTGQRAVVDVQLPGDRRSDVGVDAGRPESTDDSRVWRPGAGLAGESLRCEMRGST